MERVSLRNGLRAGLLMIILFFVGCASAAPRFSPEVQKSFRDNDMRRMETAQLRVYYPEHRQEEALHIASRLQGCMDDLEEQLPRPTDWGRVPVFLPEVEFNNAYVSFGPGNDPHIVVPTFFTANIFGELGFTPSMSAVSCHEMVHYIHLIQIHGLFGLINRIFGPSINPQIGLDLWFFEGLATYYESQLVEGVGRYGSPIWESFFAAGIQDTHLDGGRLSQFDREVPYGGHYLIGSYFVAYLAETYGEEKLWELVDRQGSSILFFMGVSLRFYRVYDRSLGALISDFEEEMRRRYQARQRPPEQQKERWLGQSAMLESGPDGLRAIYSRDLDTVGSIEIFDGNGERILRRQIPDVLPGRRVVAARSLEAMRFSSDGRYLYFLVYHLGSAQPRTTLMRLELATRRLRTVRDELRGVGGDITPDANSFILAAAEGDRVQFRSIDLEGEEDEDLFSLPPGAYVGWVRVSPDGTRLAFTLMEDEEWSVAVVDLVDEPGYEQGGLLGKWTTGDSHRPAFDPVWLDDERLLFVASDEDRIQLVEGNLIDGTAIRRSDVPYMAFNPRPHADGGFQFLNRQGWGWSLDRIDGGLGEPTEAVFWQQPSQDLEVQGDWEDTTREEVAITGYDPLQEVTVFDDSPYSSFDRLFIPRLVIPWVSVLYPNVSASLQMSGRDELGFHNWAVSGRWDFVEELPSGSVGYVNAQLAPWYLGLQAASNWLSVTEEIDPETLQATAWRLQRDRSLVAYAERSFFDIPVQLSFQGVEFFREEFQDQPEEERVLIGPQMATRYRAGRSTAYGGAQWLFGLSGSAAYYPEQLGSNFSLGDTRSQLEIHTPLPFSKRHRLRFSGRIRSLTGAPEGQNLMRVGGFGAQIPLFSSSESQAESIAGQLVPPAFSFVESLRGYEDFGLAANQVAIGDINYRYPLIIDRGAASALLLFPSVFLRGMDLEGFASGATIIDGNLHAAVGASADVAFMLWTIPLRIRYQFAQRLVDDLGQVHTISLGVGAEP